MSKRDLLSIADLTQKEIWEILLLAKKLKNQNKNFQQLKDKTLVMLFEKPSLRTKLSFDLAMYQLGGHSVYFGPKEVGLGKREAIKDVAKVISRMGDYIMARVFNHKSLVELAQNSRVSVINGLSDLEHPCQVLADLLTIFESKKKLEGLTITFVGDGNNNVSHSFVLACSLLGINFNCASPRGFEMDGGILEKAEEFAKKSKSQIKLFTNPCESVKGVDVIVTDSWVSMGKESEAVKRLKIFQPFQVNKKLFSLAKKDAIFLHCLPAHRNFEVTDDIIDSSASLVFQEAENRLHAQKALLLFLKKYV